MDGEVNEIWQYRLQQLHQLHTLVRRRISNEFQLRCARRSCDNHLNNFKRMIYPILELEKKATEMAQGMAVTRRVYPHLESKWGYSRINQDAAELHSRVRTVMEDDIDHRRRQPASELDFLLIQNDILRRRTNMVRRITKEGYYTRLEELFNLRPFHRRIQGRTSQERPE